MPLIKDMTPAEVATEAAKPTDVIETKPTTLLLEGTHVTMYVEDANGENPGKVRFLITNHNASKPRDIRANKVLDNGLESKIEDAFRRAHLFIVDKDTP